MKNRLIWGDMEMKEARRIGGGIAVQTLLFTVLVLELWHVLQETRGDFANGILFYLSEVLNPPELLGYAILFGGTYFLGRKAGKEILILGRGFIGVGLKYLFLTLGLSSVVLAGIIAASYAPDDAWQLLVFEIVKLAVLLIVTWMWAGWRIKRKRS